MTSGPRWRELQDEIIETVAADGKRICLRSIRQSDEARMRDGIARLSEQSRYMRFFSVQPMPSDPVIERLLDADGHDHIAWGAIHVDGDTNPAIGAVHAIRSEDHPRVGEFSIAVLDDYHGLGLARMLTTVLLIHCEVEAMCELEVQTLAENMPAIRFILSIGAQRQLSEAGVVSFRLPVRPAIRQISATCHVQGVQDILAALARFIPVDDSPCGPGED
jgi:GNAT superfamily N-acetyltransferase